MPDRWKQLAEAFTTIAGKWTALAAVGSFLLYLFGYLVLRFQLSTYGVATNLSALDERYLFAGSRFFVYLVSSLPSLLLIVIPLWVIFYVPYRLMPIAVRARIGNYLSSWRSPNRLCVAGTLVALLFIQFVLRQCFVYGNLLFLKQLPRNQWINAILLTDDGYRALYFAGLVAVTLLSILFLFFAAPAASESGKPRLFRGVLVMLIAIEVLLLPINYGVLIASQSLPRVSEIGTAPLAKGAKAWLVWEASDSLIYLETKPDDERAIISVPKKDVSIKIVGYDPIFRILFGPDKTLVVASGEEGHQ
ncbi:MAG TPA: hypothetical protein VJA94_00885 [Candidatus Angelobacter sp.]